ncbi:putative ribonuclease H-like domain-containing protein, partial [Tanacetum coccineum]
MVGGALGDVGIIRILSAVEVNVLVMIVTTAGFKLQLLLANLGENISQEELNLKFFRSPPSEWNTHVMVWRNKPDLDTMSFDDLYNNFKIIEQEVKGIASSSSSSNTHNMAFVSSPSSTNEVNIAYGVSTANTQVSPTSTQSVSTVTRWDTLQGNVEELGTKIAGTEIKIALEGLYMEDDEVPTNLALMALLDSEADCNYHQRERVVSGNNYTMVNYNYSAIKGSSTKKKIKDIGEVDAHGTEREHVISLRLKRNWMEYMFTFRGGAKRNPKESHIDESMLWHRIARFTWVFFLATKDETSGILKSFITEVENLVDKEVKIIRCDNGTEFCEKKGIKKEFSVARTPQQNSVAERRNRTLIEAARTMLADSKLPTTFWAEAVNTACYVQNRVLVVKPHNKTPYELFRGRTPALSFMRPFGCHVTILNTLDYLGKFDGKSDEGFFVGYSMNSKAFRVYNIRTRKVEENLHIRFLEDKPIIAGDGPKWLIDIDVLTKSMNYVPVVAGTNSNDFVGTEESIGAGHSSKETGSSQDYILMPLWKDGSLFDSSSKNASNDEPQPPSDARKKDDEGVCKESGITDQERPENSTQSINTEPDMFSLGDNATLEATHADFFGDETKVDMSNITTTYPVPSTPNKRIHKDHSLDHVIGDVQSSVHTRRMTKNEDLHTCLFACFLSQVEPKKVIQALTDPSWIKAMQDELLQFKLQKVWTLVDLPYGKRAIGTKWALQEKE